MKMHLNLMDLDLASQFGISESTVSKIIKKWLEIMYVRLRPLAKWPDCDQLRKNMPEEFKQTFPKCVCIIDCFLIDFTPAYLLLNIAGSSSRITL